MSNSKEKAAEQAAFSLGRYGVAALLLIFLTGSGHLAAEVPDLLADRLNRAWELTSSLLFNEAHAQFRGLEQECAGDASCHEAFREARFGGAVTALNMQPQSEEGLARARRDFADLVRETSDDAIGIESAYYLARMAEMHEPLVSRTPMDRPQVVSQFRQLLRLHLGHPQGDMAAAKLALLLLSDDVSDKEWMERWKECESWIPRMHQAGSLFDVRWAMSLMALQMRNRPDLALPHLLACADMPMALGRTKSNVWVMTAEVADKLGQRALAERWWKMFIREFPGDDRVYAAQKRLAERVP